MKAKYCRTLILAASAAFPFAAAADVAGIYLGIGSWNHEPSGPIQYQGTEVDAQDDLKLDSEQEVYGWVAIEHPIPVLPNIKVSRTQVSTAGQGTVTSDFVFGGQTYSASDDIATNLDLDQTDVVLYYELLDNVVSLDLGLDLKNLKGDARVRSTGADESATFDAWVPMLYASVSVGLPFTGLSVGAEGSAISYDGSSLSDYSVRVAYETDFRLGVEGGYRRQNLDLDDVDDVTADFTIDGPFLGLFFHF